MKVSKRELNELMRELLEFTENFSSDDEDKDGDKKQQAKPASPDAPSPWLSNSPNGSNEDMSILLDAYISLGTLAPLKTTPPPPKSPSNSSLHTPIPPMSPPCSRTPGTGKKGLLSDISCNVESVNSLASSGYHSGGKGKSLHQTPGKKKNLGLTPGKPDNYPNINGSRSGKKETTGYTPGKLDSYPTTVTGGKMQQVPATSEKQNRFRRSDNNDSVELTENLSQHRGKLDSYINVMNDNHSHSSDVFVFNEMNETNSIGMVGTNVATPVTSSQYSGNNMQLFSPGKNYCLLSSDPGWEKPNDTSVNSSHLSAEVSVFP